MTEADLERTKKWVEKKWKYGLLALALGLVVAPVVFQAVTGLIGLGAIGLISLVAVNAAPVLAMKAGNRRLLAIKAEAAAHPIETLQTQLQEQMKANEELAVETSTVLAEAKQFKESVDTVAQKAGEDDADVIEHRAQLTDMLELVDLMKEQHRDGQIAIAEFEDFIEIQTAKWEMFKAGAKANKAAQMAAGNDFMSKMKTDAAYRSISTKFNSTFAQLNTTLETIRNQRALKKRPSLKQLREQKIAGALPAASVESNIVVLPVKEKQEVAS